MQQKNFKDLVIKYSPIVSNTATRILRDSQSAQDVHQEVFLEIWRRWHKFNGQINWDAYIYKITIRKGIGLKISENQNVFIKTTGISRNK